VTEVLGITVLGSGSKGNACVVHAGDQALLIDVGFSGSELSRRMDATGVDVTQIRGILVSHEHSDHISGLGVLARRLNVPVFANNSTAAAIRYKPRPPEKIHIFASGCAFNIGDFAVEPFSIPHDASDPVGFAIEHRAGKVGIATDLGYASQLVCHQLRQCHILMIESNHDIEMLHNSSRPWLLKQRILSRHGHLSNADCLDLLQKILHPCTQHVVLAHASEDCNRHELIEKGVAQCLATLQRGDVRASIACQQQPLPTLWLR